MEKIEVKALKEHYYSGNRKKGQAYTCASSDLGLLVKAGWAKPVEADPPPPPAPPKEEIVIPPTDPPPVEDKKTEQKPKEKAK